MNTIIRIALIAVFLFALFSVKHVVAQAQPQDGQNPTPILISATEELDYTLPFPGILPNHPLYIFKKMRDSIMRIFLKDPVKRIEFSLLQSDKYLAMALVFADSGKWDDAGSVIVDSQKEMEQALAGVVEARGLGVMVPGHVIVSLERSTIKHKQRIDEMKIQSQEGDDGLFGKASDAFTQLAAHASSLRE